MRRESGFSLIELLIVVAIILVIAAIAIPNLLRAKMAANETSAAAQVRMISTMNLSYSNSCGGYALSMALLGPAAVESCTTGMGLVDSIVGVNGTVLKSGYSFKYTGAPGGTYVMNGVTVGSDFVYGGEPTNYKISGLRSFCSTPEPDAVRATNGNVFTPVPTTVNLCSGGGAVFLPLD